MATIIFCEDQQHVRQVIAAAMQSTPHRVHIAVDGAQGLELIQRHVPDLIVTDVVMPRLGGLALAAAVRKIPALRHVPIVFMTASLQPDEIERLAALGGTAHLSKPFTATQLRDAIDGLLATVGPHRS